MKNINNSDKFYVNNAIYFGNNIERFSIDSVPYYAPSISYSFDTHTASLLSFTKKESDLISNFVKELTDSFYTRDELYTQLGKRFTNKLIDNDIFLKDQRIIQFGNYQIASIWIQANHSCNLACAGCSTGMDISQNLQNTMEIEVFEKCLEKITQDSIEKGFLKIDIKIGGGEPTLRGIKWLENIHDISQRISKKYNIPISIVILSNGILLNKYFHDILKRNNISCVISTDPSRFIPKTKYLQ